MNLYLDIDGVVLGKNEAGKVALIPEFEAILSYLRENFNCYWLTTHGRHDVGDVMRYLKPYLKEIKPEELNFIKAVPWRTLKTEAIDFNSLFIWIDDQPLQFELDILKERRCLNRWLKVDTYTNFRELTIARIEDKRRGILVRLLKSKDPEAIRCAMLSLSSMETPGIEDLIIPFLRSTEESLCAEAASCLGSIGVDSSLIPLFYSEIITDAINSRDIDEGLTASEQVAMWMIFKRAFPRFYGVQIEEEDVTPEKLDRMKKLSPFYFLYFIKLAIQKHPDITGKGLVLDKNFDPTLGFLRSLLNNEQSQLIDRGFLEQVAESSEHGPALAKRVLDVVLSSDFPNDVKYLAALYIIFTTGYLEFGQSSNALKSLTIALKHVLARMFKEGDFRKIFAALGLFMLGGEREQEDEILAFYRKNEWFDYPRLMRLGKKILSDLSEDRKSIVYKAFLKSAKDASERERIIDELTLDFPKIALEFCERRLFELDPFEEALLYGRAGDRRGYRQILDNFVQIADVRGIEYLGKFGGEDAIALLEEARDRHDAPEKSVNDALRKIKRRLKLTKE